MGEGGVVLGADSGDGALGVESAEDGHGELGADSGDGDEALEEALLVAVDEAVEGEEVFAHLGVDVEGNFGPFGGKRGEGGDADDDVVANASGFDDGLAGLFREEASAKVGDHRSRVQG